MVIRIEDSRNSWTIDMKKLVGLRTIGPSVNSSGVLGKKGNSEDLESIEFVEASSRECESASNIMLMKVIL